MIENIIIIALFVYAVNATTWEDHIFEGVGNWAQENLPEKIYKPLIGCPICMVPSWGIVIYLVADVLGVPSFQDARWFMIIGTVIPAMGVNALIVKITGALDDVADVAMQLDKESIVQIILKAIDSYFSKKNQVDAGTIE